MLEMNIKIYDNGRVCRFFGTEREMETKLRHMFPTETQNVRGLIGCVDAITQGGFAEVEVENWHEPPERNVLPEDYLTSDSGDDPWVREGDRE